MPRSARLMRMCWGEIYAPASSSSLRFRIAFLARGCASSRLRFAFLSGLSLSIHSGTSQPLAFITLAIARSCSTSPSVKKVTASPARPARPVRPMRWTYDDTDVGKS